MFSINMLNGLFDPIINWFSAFFYYLSVGLYYLVVCGIGKIVDIIQLLFRKFAGLDDMSLAGQEGDIVLQFINSDIVQKVFWSMVVLAVVLLFITSFVAVIKTEFNKDGKNDKKKVIKNAFRGIVNFVAVPIVCIFGLIVGNALLRAIDGALTLNGNSLSMTSQIFAAGGYNSNRVRSYEGTAENGTGYKENSMADYISKGYGTFGIFAEDTTGVIKQSIADKIDSAFANNLTVDLSKLNKEQRTLVYADGGNGDYAYTYTNYFTLGAFPTGHVAFNFDEKVGGNDVVIIGDGFGIPDSIDSKFTFSIYNVGLVSYYYDLSLFAFDYLICGIALIFAAWVYLQTIIGLIKRLFMLTTLFIISPPICALYPLDEGKALGSWRSEFVKQTLSAYSVVIVMNIFFLLLPLLLQIQIIPVGTKVEIWDIPAGFVNYIARLLIIISALLFFKDATKTIAGFIGSESSYDTGSGKASAVGSRVVGGALLAGHMIGGIARHKAKGVDSKSDGGEPSKQDIDNTANNDAAGKYIGSTNIGNANAMNPSGSENLGDGKGVSYASSSNLNQTTPDNYNYTLPSGALRDGKAKPNAIIPPSVKVKQNQRILDNQKKELQDKKATLKTQKKELRTVATKNALSSLKNNLKFVGNTLLAFATGAKIKDYKSLNKEHTTLQQKVAEDKAKLKKEIESKKAKDGEFEKQTNEINTLKQTINQQKKVIQDLKKDEKAANELAKTVKKEIKKQEKNKK